MIDLIDVPFGTRYVGIWEQYPVQSREDVIRIIEKHLGTDNIGISVCTYVSDIPYLLFLPFDFDSNNLKSAWKDAKRLFNFCARNNLDATLTFSGRRGFHIYITTVPKPYSKSLIRYVQSHLSNMLGLLTIDKKLFGDIRRLMRIVYTYNMENGGLCLTLARNFGRKLDLEWFRREEHKPEANKAATPDANRAKLEYPCIEKLIRDRDYWIKNHPRHKFEPSQPVRFTWVALKSLSGYSEDEIFNEAKSFGWDDFNEYKTRYQIRHIMNRYKPYSCSSLRAMGYCIIPDCKFKRIDKELSEVGIE